MTASEGWRVRRRFREFATLQSHMSGLGFGSDLFPAKRVSGNTDAEVVAHRRDLLERYLQRIVHGLV